MRQGQVCNTVVVVDCGAQYAQLIANKVRSHSVFSVIVTHEEPLEKILEHRPVGIILSGGPRSVFEEGAPSVDPRLFGLRIPILGICYGHQLMAHLLGGRVESGETSEYGARQVRLVDGTDGAILKVADSVTDLRVWMSHADQVTVVPPGFKVIASTDTCPVAAMADSEQKLYSIQFHPEVEHTVGGDQIIGHFLSKICGAKGDWIMADFRQSAIEKIREEVGDGFVVGGLSGGVDSFTMSKLMEEAIGDRYISIFVDNGLLRKNEAKKVIASLEEQKINYRFVDASEKFLTALYGIADPEQKRKIIGGVFIEVFEAEARELEQSGFGKIEFLAQGTLYPDVIESVPAHGGPTAKIKSHHNVGGLPEKMGLKLIEPFREIFKDEVRKLAQELGLPRSIWGRHPFPGPGEAIRQLGAVKREYLDINREADDILTQELHRSDLYYQIGQAFTVFPGIASVGVMGDGRTYQHCVVIRCVDTSVYMTADFTKLPWELLQRVSNRITNEVRGVNRVLYDITSKPPATIEWE